MAYNIKSIRIFSRVVAVILGLALAAPFTFIGFGFGGVVGLALLGKTVGEANEHLALILGSVMVGGLSLVLAVALAKVVADLFEKAMIRGLEASTKPR